MDLTLHELYFGSWCIYMALTLFLITLATWPPGYTFMGLVSLVAVKWWVKKGNFYMYNIYMTIIFDKLYYSYHQVS